MVAAQILSFKLYLTALTVRVCNNDLCISVITIILHWCPLIGESRLLAGGFFETAIKLQEEL
jgi:hypothetical protein